MQQVPIAPFHRPAGRAAAFGPELSGEAALTLVELKDLDKRSRCRGLGFVSLQPLRGLQRFLLLIVTVFFRSAPLRLADDFGQIGKRLRRHRIEGEHCRKEADDGRA